VDDGRAGDVATDGAYKTTLRGDHEEAANGISASDRALALLLTSSLARAVDYMIPVKVGLVKEGQLFKFVSKGSFTLPDAINDNPVTEGGSLCFQGTTGGRTYTFDAQSWSGLGTGGDGSKGFKSKGAECKAIVKDSTIKGVCKPDTGDFGPLPDPGPVNIVLTIGDGPTRYCGECGGEPRGDDTKAFKRKDCDAPAACAACGTTTTVTTSTTTTTLLSCGVGQPVGGFCWYGGLAAYSCAERCGLHGLGYHPATETYAGSGGTDAQCEAVLNALGIPGSPLFSSACSDGFGCLSQASPNYRLRCLSPATSAEAYFPISQRACACQSCGAGQAV